MPDCECGYLLSNQGNCHNPNCDLKTADRHTVIVCIDCETPLEEQEVGDCTELFCPECDVTLAKFKLGEPVDA